MYVNLNRFKSIPSENLKQLDARLGRAGHFISFCLSYQNMQDETGRPSFDADTVDFADLVTDVDKTRPVGRAAVHYSRDHNLAGDLAGFYGRPLMSRCKLVFS